MADRIRIVSTRTNPAKCASCGAGLPGRRTEDQALYFPFGIRLYHDGRILHMSDDRGPLYTREGVREISYCEVQANA